MDSDTYRRALARVKSERRAMPESSLGHGVPTPPLKSRSLPNDRDAGPAYLTPGRGYNPEAIMLVHPHMVVRDVFGNARILRLVPEIDLHSIHVFNDLMSRALHARDLRISGLRRELLENGIEPNHWNDDLETPSLPEFQLVGGHGHTRSTTSLVIGNKTFVEEQRLRHIAARVTSTKRKPQEQADASTPIPHAPTTKRPRSSSSPPPSSRLRPRPAKAARTTCEKSSSPTRRMRSGSPSPESEVESALHQPPSQSRSTTPITRDGPTSFPYSETPLIPHSAVSLLQHTTGEDVGNVTERERNMKLKELNQQLPNESYTACYDALQDAGWDVRKAGDQLVLNFKQKYEQQRRWLGGT